LRRFVPQLLIFHLEESNLDLQLTNSNLINNFLKIIIKSPWHRLNEELIHSLVMGITLYLAEIIKIA
jgi:hypothetical protein